MPNRAEGSTREVEYRNLCPIRDNDLENIPERVSSTRENPSGNRRNVSHSHCCIEVYCNATVPPPKKNALAKGIKGPLTS